jgi:SAM-dependent methyltransferase
VTDIANHEQFEAWNGDSGRRWVASADRRDRVLAPVGDAVLAAAGLAAAEAVFDIGCGCGATTLAAATAVGPDGRALGVDLSAPMLDVARRRAAERGLAPVTFLQADVQTLPDAVPRFDVMISRFGTMFFSEPAVAFTRLRRHLRDRGRICIATWRPLDQNEWLTVPGAPLLQYATLPESDATSAGMFSQSDPAVVRTTLEAAGFTGIEVGSVDVPLRLGATVEEAVEHLADSGPGRQVLAAVPDSRRRDALAAVAESLAPHAEEDGVRLGGAIWIARARVG